MRFAEQLENEITLKYIVSFISLKVTYIFRCLCSCVPEDSGNSHKIQAWDGT